MPSVLGSGIRVGYSAVLLLAAMSNFANAQAFQNLDFEQTQVDPPSLPGWTLWPSSFPFQPHIGIQPQSFIATDLVAESFPPLAGHFSVYLQNGFGCPESPNPHGCEFEDDGSNEISISPYVAQTALVPTNAQSIRLRATPLDPYFLRPQYENGELIVPGDPDAAAWQLYMNGNRLHVYDLGGGLFGSNVSNFSGTVATLSIRLDVNYVGIGSDECCAFPLYAEGTFDSFQFSTEHIVPEPTACLIGMIGLVGCVMLKRRERSLSR